MARITIEDCIEQVPNRFKLVQMAAIRAKQLKRGASAFVDQDNKEVVTALREIAAGFVRPDEYTESAALPGVEAPGPESSPRPASAATVAATAEAEALFSSSSAAPVEAEAEAEASEAPATGESAASAEEEAEPAS